VQVKCKKNVKLQTMGTARTSLDEAVFERRLINMICSHGFLPDDFGISIIIPVVKIG